jgi:hypothetical protein
MGDPRKRERESRKRDNGQPTRSCSVMSHLRITNFELPQDLKRSPSRSQRNSTATTHLTHSHTSFFLCPSHSQTPLSLIHVTRCSPAIRLVGVVFDLLLHRCENVHDWGMVGVGCVCINKSCPKQENLKLNLVGDGLEVGKLLQGALLGEELLVDDATEGDHGKAAVLHLNEAAAGEGLGVLAEAKGVEAKIAGLAAVREHVARGQLEVVREELNSADGEEHLPQASGGHNEEVVDGGSAVLELGQARNLLRDHAGEGEHAHASVLELSLAQPLDVKVVGEANGVEAHIAGQGAVEGGGALEEGHSQVAVVAERLHAGALGHGGCNDCNTVSTQPRPEHHARYISPREFPEPDSTRPPAPAC